MLPPDRWLPSPPNDFSQGGPAAAGEQPSLQSAQSCVRSFVRKIPFEAQSRHWDCGLACALMALRAVGRDGPATRSRGLTLDQLERECGTDSVWTIDLAVLLRRRGARVRLLTLTPGVSREYEGLPFYRAQIDGDRARVEALFQCNGGDVPVEVRHVGADELLRWAVSGKYVIILLVDKGQLTHCAPEVQAIREAGHDGYIGHYVIVSGADLDRRMCWVVDPAAPQGRGAVEVSAAELDCARTAFGTDEDILLVELDDGA